MSALNVLVVGGGAREHALAWKLRQGSGLGRLFCAPGNAGTTAVAEAVPIAANQVDALADWSAANDIGLVVVGPEEPLALGLADRLRTRGIPVLGPGAAGARIESSKSWAKEIMRAAGVPTAAHATFSSAAEALEYVRHQCFPLVIKADGLAAGKGVVIARSAEEARRAIVAALEERVFGEAGQTIVIEEYLEGEEMSLIAFVSDRVVVPLLPARDHKAVGDGDTGPNTGGMGAIAPARAAGHDDAQTLCRALIEPVAAVLADRGLPYRGVLYAGLMLTPHGPRVLEFNCRFGDPEAQVILPLLEEDLVELALTTATGELAARPLRFAQAVCCGVVLASRGYPGPYPTGLPIHGLDLVDPDILVFHAGTRADGATIRTAGGRVLTVVGRGSTPREARDRAYANAARIIFEGVYYRRDIGWREIQRAGE